MEMLRHCLRLGAHLVLCASCEGACPGLLLAERSQKIVCSKRVERFTERLQSVRDSADPFVVDDAAAAPIAAVRRTVDGAGPALKLMGGETRLDGRLLSERIGDPAAREALITDLRILRRNWQILHPGEPMEVMSVYVFASPEQPAAQVFAAIEYLGEVYEPRLVVRDAK